MISNPKVFVVEMYYPPLCERNIDSVWTTHKNALNHVMEVLLDEKLRIETEESNSGNPVDTIQRLKIEEVVGISTPQQFFILANEDGYEYLGFYITEVPHHE